MTDIGSPQPRSLRALGWLATADTVYMEVGMPRPLFFAICSISEYNFSEQSDGKVRFRA
jgi:hypothetical protein